MESFLIHTLETAWYMCIIFRTHEFLLNDKNNYFPNYLENSTCKVLIFVPEANFKLVP